MARNNPIRMAVLGLLSALLFVALFVAIDRLFRASPAQLDEEPAREDPPIETTPTIGLVGGSSATPKPESEPDLIRARGESTPFQRRVAAGEAMRRLWIAGSADAIDPHDALRRLGDFAPLQLSLERRENLRGLTPFPASTTDQRRVVQAALQGIVQHGLDLQSLTLRSVKPTKDPLGHDLRLRVWEPATNAKLSPFPEAHLAIAEALLARLDRVCNRRTQRGFDVLALPKLGGTDVFRGLPSWAAGVFLRADRLSIVNANAPPHFRQTVLNHELAHAWQGEHRASWHRRFVGEGLAEYLAWLRPEDERLEVPVSRARHNFARFAKTIEWIERRTGKPLTFDMRKMVAARPHAFYAMQVVSYPLAEAAFFFVGPEVVERALVSGNEQILVDALSAISWDALRAFIGVTAKTGDAKRGRWIFELPPEVYTSAAKFAEAQKAELLRVGIDLDRLGKASLAERIPSRAHLVDSGRRNKILEGLREAGQAGRLVFACDVSRAMKDTMQFRASIEGLGAPHVLDLSATPQRTEFIRTWLAGMDDAIDSKPLRTLGVGNGVTWTKLPATSRRATIVLGPLMKWLVAMHNGVRPDETPQGLVLCLGSSDAAARAHLSAQAAEEATPLDSGQVAVDRAVAVSLAAQLTATRAPPPWVLIVDLAAGQSEALWLAQALSVAWRQSEIAFWDPAVPE